MNARTINFTLNGQAVSTAIEITSFGGWRAYIASLGAGQPAPV